MTGSPSSVLWISPVPGGIAALAAAAAAEVDRDGMRARSKASIGMCRATRRADLSPVGGDQHRLVPAALGQGGGAEDAVGDRERQGAPGTRTPASSQTSIATETTPPARPTRPSPVPLRAHGPTLGSKVLRVGA